MKQLALFPTCSGEYVDQVPEGLARAKELSRAALRELLDSTEEDDKVGSSGTATGSSTDASI